jgi:hypothetical protein
LVRGPKKRKVRFWERSTDSHYGSISSGSSSSAGAYGAPQQDAGRNLDSHLRGTLELGTMGMVTAAELLQMAYPLARQQPLPGPARLQPQPARDGDDEEGGSDDDTEAARRALADTAGEQQATGRRKRNRRGSKSTAACHQRRNARRLEASGTQESQDRRDGAMDIQQEI